MRYAANGLALALVVACWAGGLAAEGRDVVEQLTAGDGDLLGDSEGGVDGGLPQPPTEAR